MDHFCLEFNKNSKQFKKISQQKTQAMRSVEKLGSNLVECSVLTSQGVEDCMHFFMLKV